MDARPTPPPAQPEELPADLRAVARRYARQPAPRPAPADTARLVARLLAEEPAVRASAPPGDRGWTRGGARALRVARWRVRLLGRAFWVASVLVVALGAGASLLGRADLAHGAPLIMLAPLTASLGLAHALRTPSLGLRAVEASCPIGALEAGAGLVLTIVGFDCLFGLAATAAVAASGVAPFAALAAAWLGPLLLLAGVSLPIALRWGATPAAMIGGGPWLLLAAAAADGHGPGGLFRPPAEVAALAVHLAAAALGAALLLTTLRYGPAWPAPATKVAPN
jgi:hypothetical protein